MFENLKFDGKGLIPAVIQDEGTLQVLTLCYMNREAARLTAETGNVHVWRRSLGRLMMKGETSGNTQKVKSISADCENNSLLVRVEQTGVACHKGEMSCYHKKIWEAESR